MEAFVGLVVAIVLFIVAAASVSQLPFVYQGL
jgi:hypothetical protein